MDITGATQLNRRQVFYSRLDQPRSSTRAKQTSLNYHAPVQPEGRQGLSLADPARKTGKFLDHATFGSNQLHFEKGSSKLEKAGVIAGQVRNLSGQASSLTLLGMRMARMGHKLTNGHYKIPNEAFTRSFSAFLGIGIALESLSFIKSVGSTVFQAFRDARSYYKRAKTQKLLSTYDAETRAFNSSNETNTREIKELLSDTRSDSTRNASQVTLDRLTEVAGTAQQGWEIINSGLLLSTSKAVARILPGLGIALSAISTIHSGVRTASQVNALNNLATAKAATKDPLLKSLAKHIKQERSYNARKSLANTAINFASTSVAISLTASGIAAPAAFIATGAAGAGVAIGSSLFSAWHNRKLNKIREQAGQNTLYGDALIPLAHNNIGIAEKAFLARLRESNGSELKESVAFLRTFGLAENTIKKLQLAPEHVAMRTLRDVLYQDKVKFKGFQFKQTAATFSHIVGLTALAKKIAVGSAWLVGKLKPEQKNHFGEGLSRPADIKKEWFLHSQSPNESKSRVWTSVSNYRHRMYDQ